MKKQIDDVQSIPHSPWESNQRLSLPDFIKQARTYLKPISEAQGYLKHGYMYFYESETIRPDQCNEVIQLIKTIENPLENFTQFLNQKSPMPVVLFSLRYPVVTELACMQETLWMTLALLGRYRSVCCGASQEAAMCRLQIVKKLEAMIQSSEDIIRLSQDMFDRAYFQERRDSELTESLSYFDDDCKDERMQCFIYEFPT